MLGFVTIELPLVIELLCSGEILQRVFEILRVLEHLAEAFQFVLAEFHRFIRAIERVLGEVLELRHVHLFQRALEGFVDSLVAELFAHLTGHLAELLRNFFELLTFVSAFGLLRDFLHFLTEFFHRLLEPLGVAFLQFVDQVLHLLPLLRVAELLRRFFEHLLRQAGVDFFPQLAEILRLFVEFLRVEFAFAGLHFLERLVEFCERLLDLLGKRGAFFLQLLLTQCGDLFCLGESLLLLADLLPFRVHFERVELRQPQHSGVERGECEQHVARAGHPAQRQQLRSAELARAFLGLIEHDAAKFTGRLLDERGGEEKLLGPGAGIHCAGDMRGRWAAEKCERRSERKCRHAEERKRCEPVVRQQREKS